MAHQLGNLRMYANIYRRIWLSELMGLLDDAEVWTKVDLYSPNSAEGLQQVTAHSQALHSIC